MTASKPFDNIRDKQAYKYEHEKIGIEIRLHPPLPCVTFDCLNYAELAMAYYDPRNDAWMVVPHCPRCIKRITENKLYSID